MAPDSPDWTVPAPLRALLWWPGIAFALALVSPDAAVGSIALAGLVLVGVGALVGAVGRRCRRAGDVGAVAGEPSVAEPRPMSRVA